MLTKVCVNTVRIETRVIREMTNGKKNVFPKGKLKKPCRECRRQRSRNVRRLARNQKSVLER